MSLLSFQAYSNTAPVSPSTRMDQRGTLTEQILTPCSVVNFDGFTAAAGYFQVFDLATAPTTGVTVPLKSIRVEDDGSGGVMPLPSFLPSLASVTFYQGLYFAMSSTAAVYTAVATNFSVWGEIEARGILQPDTLSAVGDTTTGIDTLQVWAEAAGPKKLCQVLVTSLGAFVGITTAYLQLYAADTEVDLESIPLQEWPIPTSAAGTKYSFNFGRDGLDVESQDDDYTRRKGCTLWLSDTPGLLTKPSAGHSGITVAIKAWYK